MKQVGIREAQQNLTTLLKDLPFYITRYGKVIAVVTNGSITLEGKELDEVVEDVLGVPKTKVSKKQKSK